MIIVGRFAIVFSIVSIGLGSSNGQEIPRQDSAISIDKQPILKNPSDVVVDDSKQNGPTKSDLFSGMGDTGMGFGPGGGGKPGYSATWYPSRKVSGQQSEISLVRQNANIGVPVWRDGGDMVLLSLSVRNSLFTTNTVLPDTQRLFPNDLWNIQISSTYLHQFDNGWSGGIMTGFGSASDQPFHSIYEMNVNFFSFLKIPARNERDSWMIALMYSPAGNLNFPIPGIAYSWKPSENLNINIGIPFFLMWRPVEDLTINLSYIPLTNINARATYRVSKSMFLYTGYEFLNESYFLADRQERRDRFMGFEQRVIGGMRWDFAKYVMLDLNAGYAFERYFGEGQNQGSTLRDHVDVAPGAFLGASIRIKF